MGRSNPYTLVAINNARDSRSHYHNVKYVLLGQMSEMAVLRDLFNIWATKGYREGIAKLPQDLPGTPNNESWSEAKWHSISEEDLEMKWSDIESRMNSDLENFTREYKEKMQGRIRGLLGRLRETDMNINDLDNEIDFLNMLRTTEGNDI